MAGWRRSLLFPLIFGIAGVAVLVTLGTWQLDRMGSKGRMIAEAAKKLEAEPVPVPDRVDPARDRLLRVEAIGYLDRRELHVLSSMKVYGPGYRVITTMDLARDGKRTGRRILVDLGFVPERLKRLSDRDPPSVRLQEPRATDRVVGLLYWPDESDGWTPEPDRGRNIWFARDVAAMAAELGAEPVMLVAQSHPDGRIPLPRPPGVNIPNRHLEYMLTWFGLAAVWAVMSAVWLRATLRAGRNPHPR